MPVLQEKIKKAEEKPGFTAEILVGFSDGLIVPFAIATGASRLSGSVQTVLLAGLSAAAVGALALGFSGYFTAKNQQKALIRIEKETRQEMDVFNQIGLSEETIRRIEEEKDKEKAAWEKMNQEYDLEKSLGSKPLKSAVSIGLAYFSGGLIPLVSYAGFHSLSEGFKWSSIITLSALFILGIVKGAYTGHKAFPEAFRLIFLGAAAGWAAYFMSGIFIG